MEKNKLSREFEMANKISDRIENKHMYSPAQLAYVGDAVYELLVRSHLLNNHDLSVNKMHKLTVQFVKAEAQAHIIGKIFDELTEEEQKVVRRGRNAKVTSSPKNVDFMDYRYATGFEALFGYLFLDGEIDRLMFIFDKIVGIILEKDDGN